MDNCANLIPVRGEEGLENCTAEALKSRRGEFKDKNLCELCASAVNRAFSPLVAALLRCGSLVNFTGNPDYPGSWCRSYFDSHSDIFHFSQVSLRRASLSLLTVGKSFNRSNGRQPLMISRLYG